MDESTSCTLKAIHSTRYSITLEWVTEGNLVDKSQRPQFTLEVRQGSNKPWQTVYWGFKTKYEVRNLAPLECYHFRVRMRSSNSEGPWSDTVTAVTREDHIPMVRLYRAIQYGQHKTAKKILSNRHGSVEIVNPLGQSPLMQSVGRGDVTMVMMTLNAGADVNSQSDGSLRTPMMVACFRGFIEIARILNERGASWNIRDRNGCTAVHYAVDGSQQETLSFALDEGADIEAKDCKKWTPLMRGVVLEASTTVLTELLKRGAQVNEADHRGMTCLMFAVLSGRQKVVELLLNFGADIRAVNRHQNTALMMARAKDLKEVIPLLTPPEEENKDKRMQFTTKQTSGKKAKLMLSDQDPLVCPDDPDQIHFMLASATPQPSNEHD